MRGDRIAVIGAGIGGLVASLLLASKGFEVTVIERASTPGGKLRTIHIDGAAAPIDTGPTVFTMRQVFEDIFAEAGTTLDQHIKLYPLQTLARHAWSSEEKLDIFSDIERTIDAIGVFSGSAEARRYGVFADSARRTFETLDNAYIKSAVSGPFGLIRNLGLRGLPRLMHIRPYATLWGALGKHFKDPRLRQLFGRYATYCGSSPFLCPATLMLVAHVEREGVWRVAGGMHLIAEALAKLATRCGAKFAYGTKATEIIVKGQSVTGVRLENGEYVTANSVIVNADVSALSQGLLGSFTSQAPPPVTLRERSLSAMTWSMLAQPVGFPLHHHTVFFSRDYPKEFKELFQNARLPTEPTVYVCAQDRCDNDAEPPSSPERIFCLVNAPAIGDIRRFDPTEVGDCELRTFDQLKRCGLELIRSSLKTRMTTPQEFAQLFPGTGGALYGRASHGWRAAFQRPGSRTKISGLYLAGGSVHPGPGIPMAALSGRLAVSALLADRTSAGMSHTVAMPGGTLMH